MPLQGGTLSRRTGPTALLWAMELYAIILSGSLGARNIFINLLGKLSPFHA